MVQTLQIVALLLVATAWAFALAHAAEMPGKMRLDRERYFAVQTIYYPGFTIGGASEPLAAIALAALLARTPSGAGAFWLTAIALITCVAVHAVFWLVTQPVNRIWARDLKLGTAGARFFATGAMADEGDWKALRDRWEHSHLVRAVLMTGALVALAIAISGA
jgi:hypothetical protein